MEERAIEYFKYNKESLLSSVNIDGHIFHRLAIEALEKQIQRKPVEIKENHDFNGDIICKNGYCPICKNELSNAYLFCNQCGQRLDWSNEQN